MNAKKYEVYKESVKAQYREQIRAKRLHEKKHHEERRLILISAEMDGLSHEDIQDLFEEKKDDNFYTSLVEVYEKNIDDELARHPREEILSSSEAFLNLHLIISDFQKDGLKRDDLLTILKTKLKLE